jgi:cytochrome c peroxidase
MHTRRYTFLAVALAGLACLLLAAASSAQALTAKEKVGKSLFFDTNLSEPAGQACAACHAGNVGWTGPDASVNQTGAVYPGALAPRFGNRKPPSAAYAGSSPNLHYVNSTTGLVGGMFWDGRKTGFVLGDPLTEQAQGPFLNPLEQNNASAQVVVDKVAASSYAPQFKAVWGAYIFSDTDAAYYAIAQSIATFERSPQVSAFASKYDAYRAGRAHFTAQEKQGMKLFNDKANCSGCHVPPLFTDYSYDDLGVPKNPLNPFYGEADFNPASAATSRAPASTMPPSPRRSSASSRCRRCATSTSGPPRASSRPTGTTATSRASRRSSTSTTPATSPVPDGRACLGRPPSTRPTSTRPKSAISG